MFVDDRHPVAMMQKRAATVLPVSVRTIQRSFASSKTASVTRVLNAKWRCRSKRSATWFA